MPDSGNIVTSKPETDMVPTLTELTFNKGRKSRNKQTDFKQGEVLGNKINRRRKIEGDRGMLKVISEGPLRTSELSAKG